MPDKHTVSSAARHVLERLWRTVGGSEGELRYPLEHGDGHPLDRPQLLRLLDELEARGLIVSELRFRLTPAGRALLGEVAEPDSEFVIG